MLFLFRLMDRWWRDISLIQSWRLIDWLWYQVSRQVHSISECLVRHYCGLWRSKSTFCVFRAPLSSLWCRLLPQLPCVRVRACVWYCLHPCPYSARVHKLTPFYIRLAGDTLSSFPLCVYGADTLHPQPSPCTVCKGNPVYLPHHGDELCPRSAAPAPLSQARGRQACCLDRCFSDIFVSEQVSTSVGKWVMQLSFHLAAVSLDAPANAEKENNC